MDTKLIPKEIHFECQMSTGKRKYAWPGKAVLFSDSYPCEAVVEADGCSYHFVIGLYRNGYYLCIPNWNIGVDLSWPSDRFWNGESMKRAGIHGRRAATFVYALAAVSEAMDTEGSAHGEKESIQ